MGYTPKMLRRILSSMIRKLGESREEFVKQPGRDFTRPRTLTFETVISLLLTMSENSIGKVLMERFQNNEKTPSASAFVQQRQKLLPSALETLFHRFTDSLHPEKTFGGYHLLAGGRVLTEIRRISGGPSFLPSRHAQTAWLESLAYECAL